MSATINVDPIAITALVISLVALLATTGQVLQQYFATADGYRRCQPSVMGLWGTKTKLRWRWREFRFETIYYVPKLSVDFLGLQYVVKGSIDHLSGSWQAERPGNSYSQPSKGQKPDCNRIYFVSGYPSKERWWQPQNIIHGSQEAILKGGEGVCWVTLLERLQRIQLQLDTIYPHRSILSQHQEQEQRTTSLYESPTVPCIQIQRRSWDFMPPDVVRPLCLSTVSDIASLAVRLGMKWREFDPAAGKMRAEGQGHLLTSRIVRSLGVVLEYMVVDSTGLHGRRKQDLLDKSYLPVIGVDDMIFGTVPGNPLFDCWDRKMGTIEEINQLLELMDDSDATDAHLEELLSSATRERPGWIPGFNDIIPLIAPKMSSKISNLNNLPMPNTYHPGLLRTSEGLQVFSDELRNYVSNRGDEASVQAKAVLEWIEALEQHEQWKAKDSFWATNTYTPAAPSITPDYPQQKKSKSYHNDVLQHLDLADRYLQAINMHPENNYNKLVNEHIRMSISTYSIGIKAKEDLQSKGLRLRGSTKRHWLTFSMEKYWVALPGIAERVAAQSSCDAQMVTDAWITMVFRAFCWHHSHRLIPTKTVLPSEWHGSKMPVYIG